MNSTKRLTAAKVAGILTKAGFHQVKLNETFGSGFTARGGGNDGEAVVTLDYRSPRYAKTDKRTKFAEMLPALEAAGLFPVIWRSSDDPATGWNYRTIFFNVYLSEEDAPAHLAARRLSPADLLRDVETGERERLRDELTRKADALREQIAALAAEEDGLRAQIAALDAPVEENEGKEDAGA